MRRGTTPVSNGNGVSDPSDRYPFSPLYTASLQYHFTTNSYKYHFPVVLLPMHLHLHFVGIDSDCRLHNKSSRFETCRPGVDLEAVCEDVRILPPPQPSTSGRLQRPQKPAADAVAAANAQQSQPVGPCYSVAQDCVVVVDSVEKLREMRTHIFEESAAADGPEGRGEHSFRVVGVDCEWEPARGNAYSPVTLLQLATRRRAFLVDLMSFCKPVPLGWSNSGTQTCTTHGPSSQTPSQDNIVEAVI